MIKEYTSKEIINDIKEKIKNNTYQVNQKLPPERELMEEYNVSRTTIRNVLNQLILERMVYRIADVGVFVEKEIIRASNKVMGFTEMVKSRNRVPDSEVVNFKLVKPLQHIQEAMNLADNEMVYLIERKRSVDNQPILYEYVYILASKVKDFEKHDFSKHSLYEILRDKYNIKINYLKENVSATTVKNKVANFLYNCTTAFALKVEGVSYDMDDNVIEYGISYYHADRFSFESILVNR